MRVLSSYEEIAPLHDVPDDAIPRDVLDALLGIYLRVKIVRESTPDYTAYKICAE